jgi:methionyl-tRNA formyltransferase
VRIALACGGRRGLLFLQRLCQLAPDASLAVFSFREESFEPPFLDDIRSEVQARGHHFLETRKVAGKKAAQFWDQIGTVDLMLVVGWRYMIDRSAYERPRRGTFVIHDSLLPAYRGFSPTVWAIRHGEPQAGATLFAITDEVDAGPIVGQQAVPIGPTDTIADIAARVTEAYLSLLQRHLFELLDGTARLTPQNHALATLAPRRTREDDRIDWHEPAGSICNLVRAVTAPYRGAFCHHQGRLLIVWSANPLEDSTPSTPGLVVRSIAGQGVVVAAAQGAVLLNQVQVDGCHRCSACEVLSPGDQLGTIPLPHAA